MAGLGWIWIAGPGRSKSTTLILYIFGVRRCALDMSMRCFDLCPICARIVVVDGLDGEFNVHVDKLGAGLLLLLLVTTMILDADDYAEADEPAY